MPSLKTNLVKRIDRLPKPTNTADAMQPLFEAVSNSIHSTQDRFKDNVSTQGKITVTLTMASRRAPSKIVVEDNGIGLDAKNYDAFTTTDTDNKIARGGKGVGRLLWLDCFEAISVTSMSVENGDPKGSDIIEVDDAVINPATRLRMVDFGQVEPFYEPEPD